MGLSTNMGAAIVLLGLSVSLYSSELTEEETLAPPLPVSMSQAVEAAETAIPGQAIDAQLEIAEGRPVYEIHMLSIDRTVNRVQVDAQDGEVTVVLDTEAERQTDDLVQTEKGGSV